MSQAQDDANEKNPASAQGEKDLLDLDSHYQGLATFIKECDTPKTIAIEGKWGSGKTFAMHRVKEKLENDGDATIKCIEFNTWEYASIGYDNQLGSALLYQIHRELAGDLEEADDSEDGKGKSKTARNNSQDSRSNQYDMGLLEQLEESTHHPDGKSITLNASNKTKLTAAIIVLAVALVLSAYWISTILQNAPAGSILAAIPLDYMPEIVTWTALAVAMAVVVALGFLLVESILLHAGNIPCILHWKFVHRLLSTRPFNRATGMLSVDGNSLASVGLNLATQGAANIDPSSFLRSDDKDMASLGKNLEKNARNVERVKKLLQFEIDRRLRYSEEEKNNGEEPNRKRLVIFIDDLDRLQPIAAIGLLEDIQNFLDCHHCVFVLAMDADVVRTGVKEKYGEEYATPERQRQYLEKIVNVPYRLPAEGYGVSDELLRQYINLGGKDCSAEKCRGQSQSDGAAAETADYQKTANSNNPATSGIQPQAGQGKAGISQEGAGKAVSGKIGIEDYKESILLSGFNSSPRSIKRAFDLQQLFRDIRGAGKQTSEENNSGENYSDGALDFIDFLIAIMQIQLNEELPSGSGDKATNNYGSSFSRIVSLAAHVDSHTGKGLPPFKRQFTKKDSRVQWVSRIQFFSKTDNAENANWYWNKLADELTHLAPLDQGPLSFKNLLESIDSEELNALAQMNLPWREGKTKEGESPYKEANVPSMQSDISTIKVTITLTEDDLYAQLTLCGNKDSLQKVMNFATGWGFKVNTNINDKTIGNAKPRVEILNLYRQENSDRASDVVVNKVMRIITGQETLAA